MGSPQGSPGRGGLGLLVLFFLLLLSPVVVSPSRGGCGGGGRASWHRREERQRRVPAAGSGVPPAVASGLGGGGGGRGDSPRCPKPGVSRAGELAEGGGCPAGRQLWVRPLGSGRRGAEAWYRRVPSLSPVGLSPPFSLTPGLGAGRDGDGGRGEAGVRGSPVTRQVRLGAPAARRRACLGLANLSLCPLLDPGSGVRRQLPGMPRSRGVCPGYAMPDACE